MTPDNAEDLRQLLECAVVPEHSAVFMAAVSGGEPFLENGYLFLKGHDWLMGIGYAPARDADPFQKAQPSLELFETALPVALQRVAPQHCWVIAPALPGHFLGRFSGTVTETDDYYLLDATARVPARLRAPVEKAASLLRVTEDRVFSPAHRRLWAEFLSRADMRPNVRELYARTEAALAASGRAAPDLRLLNAWDVEGNLAASLLVDYSPKHFSSYIIGAHSKRHYTPHATDLLFASLLERARLEGKSHIHLGLGVNKGIARFKRKWGGKPVLPFVMGSLDLQRDTPAAADNEIGQAVQALLSAPPGLSKQQIFETLPQQREFAMILRVSKGETTSWLCGSAHFFRYSFEFSFRRLFEPLHTVIFEGPLDEVFLQTVEQSGTTPEPGSPRILDAMTEEEIQRLERAIYGPQGRAARFFGRERPPKLDVRKLLASARPWFAFFSLWVAYLERIGWYESVDLEAWRTAKDMGKAVVAMENLDEQLDSLESVPIARVVDFFRRCHEWPAYVKRNVTTYLNGDLQGMMGSSIEFPSRTEMVIDRRDERFRQRMRPFLEVGGCAVFVGTAHLVGLIPMLRRDGFTVERHLPTVRLRLKALLRGGKE